MCRKGGSCSVLDTSSQKSGRERQAHSPGLYRYGLPLHASMHERCTRRGSVSGGLSLATLKSTEAVPRRSLSEAERGQPTKSRTPQVRIYSRHIYSCGRSVRVSLIAYLESTRLKRSGL